MIKSAPWMFLFVMTMPSLGGVGIGHPVTIALHDSMNVLSAEAPLAKLLLTDRDGTTLEHTLDTTLDLTRDETIDVPLGVWEQATLVLDGPIRIHGEVPTGGTFELVIEVGAIFLALPEPVDTGSDVASAIQLGELSWLTADVLGVVPDQHLVVDATHPLHDELRQAFRYGSSWR